MVMSFQHALQQQILAFHTAIIDDCNRAARPGQTDAVALQLRKNALALAKVQLALLALDHHVAADAPVAFSEAGVLDHGENSDQEENSDHGDDRVIDPLPEPRAVDKLPASSPQDRILTGDALSRFVSRRLDPGESTHDVWQELQDDEPVRCQRNPALPKPGFRLPSG
jgi:hypothetical protein